MRRFVPHVLIVVLLALLGGFAYFSQYPDSPYLERAQTWPVVGKAAQWFREAYLGPETSGQPTEDAGDTEDGGTEVAVVQVLPDGTRLSDEQRSGEEPIFVPGASVQPPRRRSPAAGPSRSAGPSENQRPSGRKEPREKPGPPLGERIAPLRERGTSTPARTAPAASRASAASSTLPAEPVAPYLVSEWKWFLPGNRILAAPKPGAAVRTRLAAMAWLPVIGGEGRWQEVMYDDQHGWIDTAWQPPHPRKGARRGLLRHRYEPVQSTDWGDLVRARKVLGVKRSSIKLGAYSLLTNVQDQELLDFLDGAAVAAEEAYFARYGRLPSGDPGRTAVLFADEADYREYSESARMTSNTHVGHARTGLLAFYAEGRSREDLARTLVHEIGHLLNDRALAWRLPPWLEEGTATDLGSVWVESSRLVTEPGREERRTLELQEVDTHLLRLRDILAVDQLPPVTTLMQLNYEAFHSPRLQSYAYAHSVALVRYLLDGEEGRHAEGFLEWLRDIAAGYGADPDELFKRLEVEPEELDRDFRLWLKRQAQAARERLNERAAQWARRQ